MSKDTDYQIREWTLVLQRGEYSPIGERILYLFRK